METSDTLLVVGSAFLYIEYYPRPGQTRVVQVDVDPFEPPMPPKVTLDQATKFAQPFAKGQPHRGKIALTVLSDKVRELI